MEVLSIIVGAVCEAFLITFVAMFVLGFLILLGFGFLWWMVTRMKA